MTPTELLTRHGIKIESTAPGRYYATCPRCSAARKLGNQNKKCLGITIDDKSTRWGCSHCGWTGPEKGPANGRDGCDLTTYDYQATPCMREIEAQLRKATGGRA